MGPSWERKGEKKSKAGLQAANRPSDDLGTLFADLVAEPVRHLPRQYPSLARLSERHIQQLRASSQARFFERGSILYREGEPPHGVYVMLDGRVKGSINSSEGKDLVLGVFGSGSVLGLAATVLEWPYAITVEVIERTSALVISRRDVMKEIRSNATSAWQVAQLVGERSYFLVARLGSMELSESAQQKIARCLLELIAESMQPDGEHIHLSLSQETIAQMVGLSRETVSRLLARLRKKGFLDWRRSDLVIRNRRALEALAHFPESTV